VQEDVEVQLSRVELRRGDRMLLCSDGLVGVVSDEEIGAVLGSIEDPGEAAKMLVEMANSAGGPDNVTVIVAFVGGRTGIGSVLTGAALYRHGVRCSVVAPQAGLVVLTDGRDSGARTCNGAAQLRLPPGRHLVSLAGGGGLAQERPVEVVEGSTCAVSFTEEAPPVKADRETIPSEAHQ
jgi:hypothetical protein